MVLVFQETAIFDHLQQRFTAPALSAAQSGATLWQLHSLCVPSSDQYFVNVKSKSTIASRLPSVAAAVTAAHFFSKLHSILPLAFRERRACRHSLPAEVSTLSRHCD